jgi:hypothetical protein
MHKSYFNVLYHPSNVTANRYPIALGSVKASGGVILICYEVNMAAIPNISLSAGYNVLRAIINKLARTLMQIYFIKVLPIFS